MRTDISCLVGIEVRIPSGLAGPVRQIWVSGPVRSGNSYAQSGRAQQNKTSTTIPNSSSGQYSTIYWFTTQHGCLECIVINPACLDWIGATF